MDQTTIDNLSAQRIVHYLITPYSQWEAGRLGIIDNDGELKRQPKPNETQYFNLFHIICKRIRDLLKTSGRGTNLVLPTNAGKFYLGQHMAPTNFTNWTVSNRSNLPIANAMMSSFKECIDLENEYLFEAKFLVNLGTSKTPYKTVPDIISSFLNEESVGNVAGQAVGIESPMAAPKSDYVLGNEAYTKKLKKKKCSPSQ